MRSKGAPFKDNMTTTYLPTVDFVIRQLQATHLALRVGTTIVVALTPVLGSPEGRHSDPPSSLRFQTDGPSLWFKTTASGISTGWVQIAGEGGAPGSQNFASVLATGANSGPNSPIIDAGQSIVFGNVGGVAVAQSGANNLAIGGNVTLAGDLLPSGAQELGSNTARWSRAYIDHLVGLYTNALAPGTTLGNQYVVESTALSLIHI